MRLPCAELEIPYFERPAGSSSKLRTVRDGIRIVRTIASLIREERPLEFFSVLFAALELAAVILAWPLLIEYLETGLVPRLPTVVLSTGLALLGFLSLACGLILARLSQLGDREDANPLIFPDRNIKGRHYRAPNGGGASSAVRR